MSSEITDKPNIMIPLLVVPTPAPGTPSGDGSAGKKNAFEIPGITTVTHIRNPLDLPEFVYAE